MEYRILSHTRPGDKRRTDRKTGNEDRVVVRRFAPGTADRHEAAALIAVADGVSRCADGGAVADWLLLQHLEHDDIFSTQDADPSHRIYQYLRDLHHAFSDEYRLMPDMLESGCTFAAALTYNSQATILWSGDSPIHLLRPEATYIRARTLTIPDRDPISGALTDCFSGVTPFGVRQMRLKVQPGDIIVAATDGLTLDGEDIARSIQRMGFNQEWIEAICEQAVSVRNSDDIGVAALQIAPA